jgi:hypothetical protein
MANGDTSPSRVGQINSAGDVDALFLKKFAGEILTTFEENNVFKNLHTMRTIENGKSAQFPVTGIASASYYTPGQNIADSGNSYLSDIKKNEVVITIDDVLLASTFLSSIDDLKNHYDIRSVYANELGKALAVRFDSALAKVFIAAARSSANLTGGNTGGQYDVAQSDFSAGDDPGNPASVSGAELVSALFACAQRLDENDVPSDGRFCVLRPQEYYRLITGNVGDLAISTSAVNKDVGGLGSIASGSIPQVAGISIYKSNHIPSGNLGGSDPDGDADNNPFGGSTGYNSDFRNSLGIVSHSAAVGTVKLLDLATESEYQIERQGTLFVAKYAMGHGVLRPECAIELVS